jgi:hypothetical protein
MSGIAWLASDHAVPWFHRPPTTDLLMGTPSEDGWVGEGPGWERIVVALRHLRTPETKDPHASRPNACL